jgi:NTE family protein
VNRAKVAKMGKNVAFVLSGGGARGALQVGALRALLESGIKPDMLVGTSIGAANAAFFALNPEMEQLDQMEKVWAEAEKVNLLPHNLLRLSILVVTNRFRGTPNRKAIEFLRSHMPDPQITFGEIQGVRLYVIATDLHHGRVRIYGTNPSERVLDGVLASTTLPPWMPPIPKDDEILMDGGLVSNLPIEPAISLGATEIYALDLSEPRATDVKQRGFGPLVSRMMNAVEQRVIHLELRFAEAQGVPVHRIRLRSEQPVEVWEFDRYRELIRGTYQKEL